MDSQTPLEKVRQFYTVSIGKFPGHMEHLAADFCESYGSAAMAYVRLVSEQEFRGLMAYIRRQPCFAELDLDDCELIERLFRAGTSQTAVLDALDERRAAAAREEASAPVAAPPGARDRA
jgi:hypothetical protein